MEWIPAGIPAREEVPSLTQGRARRSARRRRPPGHQHRRSWSNHVAQRREAPAGPRHLLVPPRSPTSRHLPSEERGGRARDANSPVKTGAGRPKGI